MPLLLFLLCALWTPALTIPGECAMSAPDRRYQWTAQPIKTEYG